VLPGVKTTEAAPGLAVAVPIVGAAGGVAYVNPVGLTSEPLLVGVSVTGPAAVGVIVNVCAVDALNVSTMGVDSPPPEGVIVIVPV